IRDGHVTGVQTCALPISRTDVAPQVIPNQTPQAAEPASNDVVDPNAPIGPATPGSPTGVDGGLPPTEQVKPATPPRVFTVSEIRSEERRVGKGCRARR